MTYCAIDLPTVFLPHKTMTGMFGLFGNKDRSGKAKKEIPWIRLDRSTQLDEIETTSQHKLVAIFKHSTRCGISSMALRQFERNFDTDPEQVDLYYLDLLAFRSLSDEVAARFQVWHQSPQLILVRNGSAIHHASHHNIDSGLLGEFVK